MDFLEIFAKTDPVLPCHVEMDSVQLWAQAMNVHVRITGQEKTATFLSKKIPAIPIHVSKVFTKKLEKFKIFFFHLGLCVEQDGGYQCICEPYWTGINCDVFEPPSPCESNPCVQGMKINNF